jgi:membrane protease YdiL (CAAX protease family)
MTMHTPIGIGEDTTPWRTLASLLTAAAVVAGDLWLVGSGRTSLIGLRTIPPVLALASYGLLFRGNLSKMGLRCRPVQGYRYWPIATVVIGAAIGAFLLVAVAAALLTGHPLPVYEIRPDDVWTMFVHMCVLSPIFEESIYRFGFCTGAVRVLRPWGTIIVSGTIFGALHVLYGNPGPDNLIAGYFLAWAYFKSGTILVPVVLHSLGNSCALMMHLATWYWIHGSA